MEPQLFQIDNINFRDHTHFHKYLIKSYYPSNVPHNLTLVVGITRRDTESLIEKLKDFNFRIDTKFGSVFKIKYGEHGEQLETYLTHDEKTGIVIFYTNYRKTEDIPHITENFLLKDKETFQLFLRPPIMEQIKTNLLEHHQKLRITSFNARYIQSPKNHSKIRPNYDRTFSYWGDDGIETLEELEHYYGVSPTMLDVRIPEQIHFRIKETGLFTFYSGEEGTIKILFEIMEKAIQDSKKFLSAFKQTSYKMLPVSTDRKEFDIPISKPALIVLTNKLSYSKINEFENGLSKYGTIITSFAEEGSLFYNAEVITDSGEEYRIKANENVIKIFPREMYYFNTFMLFYKYIVEHFDSAAELLVKEV